jgi:hypothetical protein
MEPKSLTDIGQTTSKGEVKQRSKDFYFTVLEDLNPPPGPGLNPKQIAAKYGRSKQNIQHYITILQNRGYVRKVGYGTWEVTKSGHEARSKRNLLGYPIPSTKTIEIWRFGYRFKITHDNPIPGLKEQILSQGGHVWQGRVLGCWITKGKENLDIYGTVGQSSDLWSASMKALNEIATVSAYLKETYHIGLDPLHALKPDIILNDPDAIKVANAVYEEVGRIRSEFVDAGDSSKTGKPEYEAKSLKTARNTLENLTRDRNGDIEKRLETIEKVALGFMPQQLAQSNTLNMQTLILQDFGKLIRAALERKEESSIVKVEITEDTEFMGLTPFTYEEHEYNLTKGSVITLERDTANALIMNRKARIV